MTYKNLLRTLTALAVVLPAFATGAQAETIDQAVSGALQKHPTLEQAYAAQRASHQGVREESSNYYPTLSAMTAAGRVYGNNSTSRGLSVTRGAGYSNMWEGSLSINQMIFDGFRTPNMVGAAKAREGMAVATIEDVQETLALQTALAYLNVMRSRDSLTELQNYIGTLDEYSSRIRTMVGEGAADEAELQQAEGIKLEVQNLIASFQGQAQSAYAEYAKLTGHLPSDTLLRPAELKLPATAGDAISQVWMSHPKVLTANQEIIAAGFEADGEKSAYYPKLSGELSAYAKDVDDIIGGEVEDNRALVRANWEFSTGGAEIARARKAKELYAQSKAKKDETLRTLEATVRQAYADLNSAQEQKRILGERLDANQKLMQTYHVQFEGAKVRILQLLQGENQILNSKLDLINADYRALAAQYSVVGSMGTLRQTLKQGVMTASVSPAASPAAGAANGQR